MPSTMTQARGAENRVAQFYDLDPRNDQSLVAFAENRWSNRDTSRQALERQWFTNISQVLGYQYHTWDNTNGKMILPEAPPWRVRLVGNRLLGIVRKGVAKALRQRPAWQAIPATNEVEDVMVSVVATKVLRYYWRVLDCDRLATEMFTWLFSTGNCFMSIVWDPNKGPNFTLDEEDISGLDSVFLRNNEDLIKEVMGSGLRLGDPTIGVHGPFEVDPDPNCERLEDAEFLVHSKVQSIAKLRDRYGDKARDLIADQGSDESLTRYYQKRIQHLAGPFGVATGKNDEATGETVLTHCLWVRPSRRYPKGYYCVVAGGKVVHKEMELPNPFHEIPFVHMVEIPVAGRFWGTSAVEHCIGLQGEYNRGRSQLIENRNLTSRPKWLLPKGSGVAQTAITSQPGEVIEYNYPLKPEAWTPPPVPDYVRQLIEYALKDMEDVSSIHEVTQARAPSGVRSGVAIAQLQEQDDQMLAPTFMLAERGLGKLGSWLLQLVQANVDEERVIKLVGKDRDVEAMVFSGKSLMGKNGSKPGVNYFDVELQMGSQLPLSKQARLQFVIDLVNNGILDRVQDRKKILELIEIGADEGNVQDEQLDRQAARRENLQMVEGVAMEINPWDNDMIHLEEHERFQKQPDYLTTVGPEIIQSMEEHKAKHRLRLQALQAPPPEAAPSGAQPVVPELEPPPPEAELPLTEEEALAAMAAQGQQIPPELIGA